jgi:hypothetical protein
MNPNNARNLDEVDAAVKRLTDELQSVRGGEAPRLAELQKRADGIRNSVSRLAASWASNEAP